VALIDDEELTAEALAADPEAPLGDEAVSFWDLEDREPPPMPDWYMGARMTATPRLHGWKRHVAWTLVVAFVLINLAGLCSTYGVVTIA
jgi:hypothetical protein